MVGQASDAHSAWMRSPGLHLAAIYGGIVLLGMVLMTAVTTMRVHQASVRAIDAWGQSTVQQLAQAAVDPVVQHDAIALQAHLGRFAKTAGLLSVSVVDADKQLLAQAGLSPAEYRDRASTHHYSLPLVFGAEMVGEVTVVMDATGMEALPKEIYAIEIGVGVAMLLLTLLFSHAVARRLHRIHRDASEAFLQAMPEAVLPAGVAAMSPALPLLDGPLFHETLSSLGEYVDKLQHPAPAQLLAAASELLNPADACAYILLDVRKLETLQRQVSKDRLRGLLDDLLRHVENTARLYTAQRVPVAGASIKLVFPAQAEPTHTAFQALCCAYVLSGVLRDAMSHDWGVNLHWTVSVDWHAACGNELLRNAQRAMDEQRSHWLGEQVGSGQMACSEAVATQLAQQEGKITLTSTPGTGGQLFYRLATVAESHRNMLDRQIGQLQSV